MKNKEIRRIVNLIHDKAPTIENRVIWRSFEKNDNTVIGVINELLDQLEKYKPFDKHYSSKKMKDDYYIYHELKTLILGSGISNDELCKIVREEYKRRTELDSIISKQTRERPKKDNDGYYNGRGGSNRNKVRYPSKKRSRRTWKKFYELFPRLAEIDN